MKYNKKKTFEEAEKQLEATAEGIVKYVRSPKKVDPFAAARHGGKSKGKVVTQKDLKGGGTYAKPKRSDFPMTAKGYNEYINALTVWNKKK